MLKDSRSFWNMKSLPNRNVQTSPTILRRMHTRLCPPNGENPHEMRRKDTRYTQSTLHESLTRDNILFRLASLSPPPSLSLSLSLFDVFASIGDCSVACRLLALLFLISQLFLCMILLPTELVCIFIRFQYLIMWEYAHAFAAMIDSA